MQYVQVARRLLQAAYSRKPTASLARSASSPFVERKGCLEDLAAILVPRPVSSLGSIEIRVIDGLGAHEPPPIDDFGYC
jgi:gamma-glutamyl:cysteine ligase YbdK (ATP-grasp superfamily)